MKKSVAIFAMTTLGLQSVQAGFFDEDFTGVADIDGLSGTEFEVSKTRVNDASALNNILKSLKYLKSNAASGKFIDGTTAADAVFTGGNVGIGTDSPEKALHISSGDSGVTPTDANVIIEDSNNAVLKLFTPNTSGGFIGFGDPENDQAGLIGYEHNEDYLKFVTNDSEKLRITETGNVGIGTTDPTAKLDIKASGDGVSVLKLGTERPWVFKQTGVGAVASLDLSALIPDKNFTISSPDGSVAAKFRVRDGDNSEVVLSPGSGGVGIGTTNPEAKLEVKDGNILVNSDLATGVRTEFRNSVKSWYIGNSSTGNFSINDVPELGTDPKFHMLSNGNIGIGKPNPTEKIDVDGAVKIASTASTCDATKEGAIQFVTDAQGDGTNVRDFQGCMGIDTNADNTPDVYEWKSLTGIVQ